MRKTALMPLYMDFFVLFTGERLITDLTHKWLLSSMTTVVCSQGVLLLERHGTSITFKGVVFNMPVVVIF